MTETTATPLQEFPVMRRCPFNPPPEFVDMGRKAPVTKVRLFDGQTAWVVSGYAETKEILADPRFSSNRAHPGFPMLIPMPDEARQVRNLITMDPPEHTARRRMVMADLTARRMRQIRPQLQQTADELIDQMLAAGSPGDLVSAYSLPFASTAICLLLGVPYDDREFFEECSRRLINGKPEEMAVPYVELFQYVGALVTRKQQQPEDDLISRLATEYLSTGALSHPELADFVLLLLAAGHATTAAMISVGTALLLEHPDQLAQLKADASMLPGAVEELLRYLTVADLTTARVCVEDVEKGGKTIRAGEGVVLMLSMANRDPKAFPEPDSLDLHRAARHHVAFGHGPHQCVGASLSRVELEVAYETLFRRLPDLRVTERVEDLVPPEGTLLPDIKRLPVAW